MYAKANLMALLLSIISKKPNQTVLSHHPFVPSTNSLSKLSMSHFDKTSILYKWVSHDDASFHNFDAEEAAQIRQSLLTWYYANRRALPWRGDCPPYDGSTAGINKSPQTSLRNDLTKQTNIQEYFPVQSPRFQKLNNNENGQDITTTSPIPVSAYGVWVSEIMLQQTRVEAVIPYYIKWMNAFPTVHHLAQASDEDVNAHWAGLGFYRRAKLLHSGAKLVADKYGGELPQTVPELLQIHGIGQYTASAIASIAFDVCVPVVDGNVCRVLSRLCGIANHIKAPILKDKLGWHLAEQIVKAGNGQHAGDVNQALMELGATYCAPSGTGIDQRDPLMPHYMSTKLAASFDKQHKILATKGFETFPIESYLASVERCEHSNKFCALCGENKASILTEYSANWKSGKFSVSHGPFPLAPPKGSKREEVLVVAVLTQTRNSKSQERWLLVKRPTDGLLAGQWEFPAICVWSSADAEPLKKSEKKQVNVNVPFIEEKLRTKKLTSYLGSLSDTPNRILNEKRSRLQESVDHIFSHVRHTMWIEHGTIECTNNETSWMSSSGKELRWMSKDDMEKVGVTSGVKKILRAVTAKDSKKRSRT